MINLKFANLKQTAVLLLFLSFFIFLYTTNLSDRSFYLDEGAVITLARQADPSRVISMIIKTNEVHPPLYFLLIHHVIAIFGISPFFLRLTSVLTGLGCIAATYLLACDLFDRETAVGSSFTLLFLSSFTKFSKEIRMYPLLTLFWCLSLYFLLKSLKSDKKGYVVLLTVVNVLSLYTHYFSFFMIFSQVLLISIYLIRKRRWKKAGSFALSYLICFFCFIPWLSSFLKQLGSSNYAIRSSPGISDIFKLPFFLSFGDNVDALFPNSQFFPIAVGAAAIAIIVYFLWNLKSENRKILGLYFLFTPVAVFLLSAFTRFRIFAFKYFLFLIPFLAIAYGRLIVKSRNRIIPIALIAVLLITNGFSFAVYNFSPENYYGQANWKLAGKYLSRNTTAGDLLIIHPSMFYTVLNLYYRGPAEIATVDQADKFIKNISNRACGKNRIVLCMVPHHPLSENENLDLKLNRYFIVTNVFQIRNFYPRNRIRIIFYRVENNTDPESKVSPTDNETVK